uniref:Ycf53 n=1 Tax=Pterocladia lucida TaxID=31408 RepID=A0A6M3WVM8_PTELU|nr:Ycf53 [Pterocladia lucida]
MQLESNDFDSNNRQLELIEQIVKQDSEDLLLDVLIDRCILKKKLPTSLDGIIFEILRKSSNQNTINKLNSYFCDGLVELQSYLKLDFQPLQKLLISQNFKEADALTQVQLCQLAGLDSSDRKWLYFTDIAILPLEDLCTLDILWSIYSRGKFGLSVQRKIWLSNNCDWEKLWNKIGWENNGIPLRYPHDFTWSINAPRGHLPLFNQLRGVRVLSALFNHTMWKP